jgi:putative ABC transport system ATP-binding protein
MSEPMVRVEHLTKSYPGGTRIAIDDVSLDVAPGEFVAVTGRSGSGKTTLLNVVGGLDLHCEGRVAVGGRDLRGMSDAELSGLRNRTIGFVFQAFHLLPHLTVLENVILPAAFGGVTGEVAGRGRAALWRVGLQDKEAVRPTQLSAGERQRVAIARAILNKPALLLCDEPTGNLDAETGRTVLEIFLELNRRDGTTLLVATHEQRVSDAATRRVVLEAGRVFGGQRSEV